MPSPQGDIYTALALVEIPRLVADTQNDYLKTGYLSMPALLEIVKPALRAVGVVIVSGIHQDPSAPGAQVCTTRLVHAASGTMADSSVAFFEQQPSKVAGAAGWGLRINLMQLLALSTADDDKRSFPQQQAAAPAQQPWQQAPAAQQPAPLAPAPVGAADFSDIPAF